MPRALGSDRLEAIGATALYDAMHAAYRKIGTIDGRMTYATARWGKQSIVEYYLSNVVGGPGSFAIEARDYAVFGEALKRKLLLEFIAQPGRGTVDGAVFKIAAASD